MFFSLSLYRSVVLSQHLSLILCHYNFFALCFCWSVLLFRCKIVILYLLIFFPLHPFICFSFSLVFPYCHVMSFLLGTVCHFAVGSVLWPAMWLGIPATTSLFLSLYFALMGPSILISVLFQWHFAVGRVLWPVMGFCIIGAPYFIFGRISCLSLCQF